MNIQSHVTCYSSFLISECPKVYNRIQMLLTGEFADVPPSGVTRLTNPSAFCYHCTANLTCLAISKVTEA